MITKKQVHKLRFQEESLIATVKDAWYVWSKVSKISFDLYMKAQCELDENRGQLWKAVEQYNKEHKISYADVERGA